MRKYFTATYRMVAATCVRTILIPILLTIVVAGGVGGALAARAIGGPVHTTSFSLDNVALTVQSPTLPSLTFAVSAPTSVTQAAAAEGGPPFHALSIFTVPFGTASPDLGLPAASPGGAADYIRRLTDKATQAGAASTAGPAAVLFGQSVPGRASRIGKRLPGIMGSTPTEYVQWVVEAGNRLWVVTEERHAGTPQSGNAATPFGAALTISSPNPDQPTTIPTQLAASNPAPALATTQDATIGPPAMAERARSNPMSAASAVAPATSLMPATLPFPSWWTSTCDQSPGHPGYLLTTGTGPVDGMQICSPGVGQLGGGVLTYFYPGAQWVKEWQCVELSFRYIYLAWGVNVYSIDDALHIADYFPFSAGHGVVELQNNNTPGQYPLPGDVIQMTDFAGNGHPGHTGVVESASVDGSGSGTITMVTENGNLTGREHLAVGANGGLPAWHIGGDGPNYTTAWLHRYAIGAAPFAAGIDYLNHPAVYARGTNNGLWVAVQDGNGNWPVNNWTSLGATLATGPVFGRDYQSHRAVAAQVTDGTIWVDVQGSTGTWIWTSLGGATVGDPAFGYDYLGHPAIFARGTDGAMWAAVQGTTGSWTWTSLGGGWTSDPAFGGDYAGYPAIFARGTDGAMWAAVQGATGAWTWTSLGGIWTSDPAFGRDYLGRPAVFALGINGAMYVAVQDTNGSWPVNNWTSLGGIWTSDPAFGNDYAGQPAVFARGTNAAMYVAVQGSNGSWSVNNGWTSLGGIWTSGPAFGRDYQGHTAVFALGTNAAMYVAVQGSNGSWPVNNWWTSLGGIWH